MDAVRASSVEGAGVRLAVREQGDPDAPTVLLVHGYPDNSSVWDELAGRLAGRFHVVRYDVRGCGNSEAPPDRAGYRLEHLAADLAAVARATSPGRPVHLVAHDWGSIQGWQAVTEPAHAGLFASYTTMSGPCLDHVGHWLRAELRRRPGRVLRQLLHSTYIGFFQLPGLPELSWRLPFVRRAFRATARDARNGIELYRANMLRRGSAPGQRRTDVPVQQLALLRDAYVLPDLLAAADPWCTALWRRSLPFGHWAVRGHADVVAERVTEFIAHVDGAPAGRELREARIGDRPLVLITGAASGIGRACARSFAADGAQVLVVDIDAEGAARVARECGGTALVADVADAATLTGLAERVRAEHGVPDIVLANAGIGMAGPFLATSEADWRRVVDVNLLGVVHTLRAFAPMLVERGRGGHLVITASAAAFTPWPVLSAYATTKAAVLSLAQSLRTELAPHRIGVSAICPGLVNTGIAGRTRFVGQDEAAQERSRAVATRVYRRRDYPPERVAAAVRTAVRHNRAVVPVTPEAHLAALAARLTPPLIRALGRLTP